MSDLEDVLASSRKWAVQVGDCRAVMAGMPAGSVDAVVCDPPYELAFMGRSWDQSGVAFQKETWEQVERVLKPGGHLLAFGGTRTYHRLACAIEDAGFEIRDEIGWVYSTGFPKSLDVSKAADRANGSNRPVTGTKEKADPDFRDEQFKEQGSMMQSLVKAPRLPISVTRPYSLEGWVTDGLGTALKPAHEPICVARKPLIGTVAQNVLTHGTGALNIAGSRVGSLDGRPVWDYPNGPKGNTATSQIYGNGEGLPRREDPITGPAGRWPPNLLLTHDPGCRPNGRKVVPGSGHWSQYDYGASPAFSSDRSTVYGGGKGLRPNATYTGGIAPATEEMESWSCAPGCPVAEMDRQSGDTSSDLCGTNETYPGEGGSFNFRGRHVAGSGYADSGGASRFFPAFSWDTEECSFIYEEKASRSEREAGLTRQDTDTLAEGAKRRTPILNRHPTVKPVDLMAWLCRLVTPPGGVVLDPFLGSGSTGCAAVPLGFRFIGIEQDDGYAQIARQRIAYWERRGPRERPNPNPLLKRKVNGQRKLTGEP
ncbi:MAG TPA: site-specific DNA-methyltransferase [Thermoplasmata archaeon]